MAAGGEKNGKPKSAAGRKAAASVAPAPDEDFVTTAIHLPKDLLRLLREVAVARAEVAGGRPSVSAVLVDLVRQNRDKLAEEAGR